MLFNPSGTRKEGISTPMVCSYNFRLWDNDFLYAVALSLFFQGFFSICIRSSENCGSYLFMQLQFWSFSKLVSHKLSKVHITFNQQKGTLLQKYCSWLSRWPRMRATARLSHRYHRIARVSQHGQMGWDTPRPVACALEVRYPPFKRCISTDLRDTIWKQGKTRAIPPPLCDMISKGDCAIWGVTRDSTADPLRHPFFFQRSQRIPQQTHKDAY